MLSLSPKRQTLEICSPLLRVLMLQHLLDIGSVLSHIPKYEHGSHKSGKIGRYVIGWKVINKQFMVQKTGAETVG